MEKEKSDVRKNFVRLRMNDDEFNRLKTLQAKTTEKILSNYLRKVILQQPVIFTHRNLSADDFLREMSLLRKELNAIGHNYNQAVKKLHTIDNIPEFRFWIQQNEIVRTRFLNKVEEIKSHIYTIYERWSQI